ncbi:hypothetical protein EK21DRAFT_72705 [Setomelanomma holmii]|uniref:mRNA N(6)-methyladenine demethylase n=1 Tax=Setomelanomma holmii TaxID=210430 RepID=A0A9P4H4Z9_9PLEO|nr:hypothetical protein EK21DRAFT_72705 [Setomelanomma holmii]
MQNLDPHERPPEAVRNMYKKYQKMKSTHLGADADIMDIEAEPRLSLSEKVRVVRELETSRQADTFAAFASGLHIIPSLLPPEIQVILMSRLLHRDLSNPLHLTNIHTHYKIKYPSPGSSFFSTAPTTTSNVVTPLDPMMHKPFSVFQLLDKKLRWTTLGGQYDWTAKQYPETPPPAFPADIKTLLESLFPETKAEAAIVNLYSPGDTLSVHRDVAETSSHGLISISLGCDAIFVIGTDQKILTLRLRSGSAVYMSGASRFAWHGVPQIVPETCPQYLKDWPGTGDGAEFEIWKGWMEKKRVNLNVRQMWD